MILILFSLPMIGSNDAMMGFMYALFVRGGQMARNTADFCTDLRTLLTSHRFAYQQIAGGFWMVTCLLAVMGGAIWVGLEMWQYRGLTFEGKKQARQLAALVSECSNLICVQGMK